MRRSLASCGLSAVVVGLTLGGCGSSSGSSSAIQIHGTLTLNGVAGDDYSVFPPGGDGMFCTGEGGYSDIMIGAAVTISNASGTVIGSDSLEQGQFVNGICSFSWETSVPKSTFYEVEISHRGEVTYPLAEAQYGSLDSSLGSS